jgi:signal transduction histidine kinase
MSLQEGEACYKSGLRAASSRNYPMGVVKFLLRLGFVYELQGEFAKEINYFLTALRITEQIGDSAGIGNCYNSMGNLYNSLSDYDLALDYHQKALAIRQKVGKADAIAGSYNNIGNTYLSQYRYAEALTYYQRAETINVRENNHEFLSSNYSNMGLALDGMGKSAEAIEYHQKALAIRSKKMDEMLTATSKIYLGTAYSHLGDHRRALELLQEGMEVAIQNDAKATMERGYEGLYQIWKLQGNHQKALFAHEQLLYLRDSLRSNEVAGKVARAQLQFQTERDRREAELIAQNAASKAEASRERERFGFLSVLAGISGLLVIFLLLAIFFAIRYRSKKRSEAVLEARVQERTLALQAANDELSKFIYQSSHDMRSPLTSIKGLVSIAMSPAGEGQERHYIELILGRVNHLDGVYTGLIELMNVKERKVEMQEVDGNRLRQLLLEAISQKRDENALQIEFDFPTATKVNSDEFLLLAILKTLVLNAIDFQDATRPPHCKIQLQNAGNQWALTVSDNGSGINPEFIPKAFDMFARGSNKSRGSGLGLYTARLAAEKLGGTISLKSEVGTGTQVTVTIP